MSFSFGSAPSGAQQISKEAGAADLGGATALDQRNAAACGAAFYSIECPARNRNVGDLCVKPSRLKLMYHVAIKGNEHPSRSWDFGN